MFIVAGVEPWTFVHGNIRMNIRMLWESLRLNKLNESDDIRSVTHCLNNIEKKKLMISQNVTEISEKDIISRLVHDRGSTKRFYIVLDST